MNAHMRKRPAASRVPRSSSPTERSAARRGSKSSAPRTKKLGDRGAKVIENGGEPIFIDRNFADAKVPNRDLPFSVPDARDRVTDDLLTSLQISRSAYDAGAISDVQRRALFLALYSQLGNVRLCASAVGVSRFQVEAWRMDVENFKRDMDLAYDDCVDELEQVARTRAVDGRPWAEHTDKSLVDGDGNPIGTFERTTKHGVEVDNGLLMFLLKGQRASRYGNRTEVSGPDGGPIPLKEIVVRIVDPKSDDEDSDVA